ncbi:MAG: tetratricopeptide repeat protein [Myxococcaceae bacterium]|nr:tetratricopeptide repeat protein [Myxococcaceae bacterium]
MHTFVRRLAPLFAVLAVGCAHVRPQTTATPAVQQVTFDDVVITGDLELEKLNDEELFAAGTSFYAAEDWAQAARYFSRICDFHPNSKHRRLALYNAGLSFEKLKAWDEAYAKFIELADPAKGTGDSLDAAFRVAEVLYHLERFAEAIDVLRVIADRPDLSVDKRIEARTQQGICELESNDMDTAEKSLRSVLAMYTEHPDKELIDEYFPAQAQFFVGEIYRLRYESVVLDANKSTEKLADDLEYKSELLLSSQGHYLRAIRLGNGYWATAAGQRIGQLYENMYDHMTNAPAPADLSQDEQDVYRAELRKKIRVLISKAITVYERTLEAAERIGAQSPFVEETRASLQRMKQLLLAEAKAEEEAPPPPPPPPPPAPKGKKAKPHS